MSGHHLAQVNIALPLEPLTSARLSGFVAALDEINALADAAPGFVWRLQTEDGDATAIRLLDDDRLIVNMSVWSSMTSLTEFVYHSDHVRIMRQRRTWFETMSEAYQALWWVPAGHLPTVAEAEQRITHLRAHGPTEYAFTFRSSFPSPSATEPSTSDIRQAGQDLTCPA
ncbi:DUF3291 domain-containing protein [Nocardia sp. CA2R105]|uniref:DUF3291 domain-containing protein n=1 Tax=Nocardia coffeae TaxID=2873381 RepID=UPI001CA76896|nr:DUF3291 domain-containing protein [Nocardia coffeae]MBY8861882.1 DUF3291 domain-containing protein [Nocardia coffeae]